MMAEKDEGGEEGEAGRRRVPEERKCIIRECRMSGFAQDVFAPAKKIKSQRVKRILVKQSGCKENNQPQGLNIASLSSTGATTDDMTNYTFFSFSLSFR